MRWFLVALAVTSGCRLEIVEGTAESARETGTGSRGTSAGTGSGGPTAGSSGATSSGGAANGGSSSGNGTTGGTTAGGTTTGGNAGGGSTSSGTTTGSSPTCDAGLTLCTYSSPLGGTSQGCFDTSSNDLNCGTCDNDCATSYGTGSSCRFGICSCDEPEQQLCTEIPSGSPPACDCVPAGPACESPSFKRDIYPFLAQQTGAFGCSASGCHSGTAPAGDLAFLDSSGHEDAGMAYAELTGTGGVNDLDAGPFCDAGVPAGAPSQCACVSRVLPGNIYASYLIDTLANDLPGQCSRQLPMPPPVGNQAWVPVPACSLQLVEQWVATGAPQ